MKNNKLLRRILNVRKLEEDVKQTELKAAFNGINIVRQALAQTVERRRNVTTLIESGTAKRDNYDQLCGLGESLLSAHLQLQCGELADAAEDRGRVCQNEFLSKRTEHKQVNMLVNQKEASLNKELERREQQDLDDSHQSRKVAANRTLSRS